MLVFVKRAERVHGVGKASSKPYDFTQLLTLCPSENVSQGNYNRISAGLEDMKPLSLDPSLLPFFQKIPQDRYPIELEITIELRPNFGEYVNTVTKVSFPVKVAA